MSPPDHIQERYRTMFIAVCSELVAFGFSLVAALLADSLTLWANCLRIGLELPASFFALYVTHRIRHAKTGKFDYGLGKWEDLAALINVPVMVAALGFLAFRAVQTFQHPHPVTGTGFGFVTLLVFGGFNLVLLRRFYHLHRAASTPVIHAQFVLYRNAAAASLLSLLALFGTWISGAHPAAAYFDILGAAILGGLMIHGMTVLVRHSLSALLDETVEESLQLRIQQGLETHAHHYQKFHRIRSRRSGNQVFVEVFIEFEARLPANELIGRSSEIKKQIEESIPGSEVWVVPITK